SRGYCPAVANRGLTPFVCFIRDLNSNSMLVYVCHERPRADPHPFLISQPAFKSELGPATASAGSALSGNRTSGARAAAAKVKSDRILQLPRGLAAAALQR